LLFSSQNLLPVPSAQITMFRDIPRRLYPHYIAA
jgi:hypothetical protein